MDIIHGVSCHDARGFEETRTHIRPFLRSFFDVSSKRSEPAGFLRFAGSARFSKFVEVLLALSEPAGKLLRSSSIDVLLVSFVLSMSSGSLRLLEVAFEVFEGSSGWLRGLRRLFEALRGSSIVACGVFEGSSRRFEAPRRLFEALRTLRASSRLFGRGSSRFVGVCDGFRGLRRLFEGCSRLFEAPRGSSRFFGRGYSKLFGLFEALRGSSRFFGRGSSRFVCVCEGFGVFEGCSKAVRGSSKLFEAPRGVLEGCSKAVRGSSKALRGSSRLLDRGSSRSLGFLEVSRCRYCARRQALLSIFLYRYHNLLGSTTPPWWPY